MENVVYIEYIGQIVNFGFVMQFFPSVSSSFSSLDF